MPQGYFLKIVQVLSSPLYPKIMPTALSGHLGVVLANRPQSLPSNSEKENRTSVGKTGNQLYSLWIFSLSNPQYQKSLSRNYPQKQGNSVKNGRYVQATLAA